MHTRSCRLRSKGAITAKGALIKAVRLTADEEDTIETLLLIQLAEAGVVL
jgi:hypothetical protein